MECLLARLKAESGEKPLAWGSFDPWLNSEERSKYLKSEKASLSANRIQ
jgi:hypothetical protein